MLTNVLYSIKPKTNIPIPFLTDNQHALEFGKLDWTKGTFNLSYFFYSCTAVVGYI